jgi:protease-4
VKISKLVLTCACAMAALVSCARPRTAELSEGEEQTSSLGIALPSRDRVVEIDLSSGAPETTQTGGLLSLPQSRTLLGLLGAIDGATKDARAKAVFVRLGLRGLDFTRSESLGRAFERLRRAGKPVTCHAHAYDNASTAFALRACDRVWLSPAGAVETIGIAAHLIHVKGLFDKLDVRADFVSAGKYKSFAETFTHEAPSEAARESMGSMLSSLRASWLESTGSARPAAKGALEQGPWTPEQAKAQGLVDAIGYESEALDEAKQRAKVATVEVLFGPRVGPRPSLDLASLVRLLSGVDQAIGARARIAIVPAEGGINMQAGGPFDIGGITADAMVKTLRRLRTDSSVKAVVLRIDSPGGSALASDIIWRELMELRKEKPIIASVATMAASGGYYLASAGNRVFAERSSIVGSIGVVGGKIVIGPALEKFGVSSFVLPASPAPDAAERAAYLSALEPWGDTMRAKVSDQLTSIYDLFVRRVAEGRGKPEDVIRASAEGRIWSGAQGLERGLVDEIGGLEEALAAARKAAGLGDDAPVSLEGVTDGLLDLLLLGDQAEEGEIKAAFERYQQKHATLAALIDPALFAHFDSFLPLMQRELVVAALPVSLSLR